MNPFPQLEVAGEFAFVVVELGVLLVGLGLGVHRAVAHVLHAHGAGDHQHFVECFAATRFQNHAAHAGVQRQAGQLFANGGQLVVVVDCAQLGQQLVAVGDRAFGRCFDEREVFHHTQVQALHAQDHARQRRAQDFRVGEARAACKVFVVVQANANAVGHAATAARTLVGSGLADRLDHQLLNLAAQAVALDPRRACVDHIPNAGHRQRGFGHVGGQHDAAAIGRLKNLVLLGLRQAGKQRQHLGPAGQRLVRQVLAQVVGSFADLALAGQKDQDVAPCPTLPEFVHRIGHGLVQAVVTGFFKRAVALLHREGAARDHDHRGRTVAGRKVLGKAVGVDGGRGDHDFEVRAARQDLAQVAQQEVDVQAAFVRLVDDDGVIRLQQRVGLGFGQQNAVGHELDRGVSGEAVLKPHLETDHLAQRGFEFFGNALGHRTGRNTSGLGVANHAGAFAGLGIQLAAPQHQRNFGQLRGLA